MRKNSVRYNNSVWKRKDYEAYKKKNQGCKNYVASNETERS